MFLEEGKKALEDLKGKKFDSEGFAKHLSMSVN